MRFFMKNNIAIELYDKNIPLAFDLDDTLYKEFDFLSRAYLDISKSLYNDDWEDAYNYLCNEFKKKGRKNLFNKLISYKNINNIKIDDCLEILRSSIYKDKIPVYGWFTTFIKHVDRPYTLRIITNGNPKQQENKFLSLNFDKKDINIEFICANYYGGKPNAKAFSALKDSHHLKNMVFIGDSDVDLEFCKNSKIKFLNVRDI